MILLYRYVKRKRAEAAARANEQGQPAAVNTDQGGNPYQEHPAQLPQAEPLELRPVGAVETQPAPADQVFHRQEVQSTTSESSPLHQGRDVTPVATSKATESTIGAGRSKEEKKRARIYRLKIIVGMILPFALQALDVTIIASALPWIAADFGQVSQLNWIISAFNLTSAAFIPFWGQLTDIFGRHSSLQAAIIIMMIGSAICTGAPTHAFPVLLLGRGFQGLGCAGLNVIVRVILADKVSLQENAKNWSIFSFTAGISYGIGPVIGGYLTNSNWRWCFGINLPICAVAIVLIIFVLRKELLGAQPLPGLDEEEAHSPGARPRLARFSQRILTIDIGGQVLFLFGFGLIILALIWGGATYDWNTAAVLVPLCVGAALTVAFIVWERLMRPGSILERRWPAKRPMVPWKLLVTRDIGFLFYINFATGAAMYSVLYFCNLYFTMVKEYTPDKAGVQLLYYTPGLGVGVYMAMFMCNVYPRKTFVPLALGSIVEAVGVGILAYALWTEHTPTVFGMMALTGAGTGLRFMPGSLHAIGLFPDHIATVVSLMAVALPFGGTLALTIMSTVFNNTSGIGQNSPLRDFDTLSAMPENVKHPIQEKAKMGIVWAFVAITPLCVLCIMAAMCLGNVNIAKEKKQEGEALGPSRGHDHIVSEPYLLYLARGGRRREVIVARDDAEKNPVVDQEMPQDVRS